MTAVVITYIFGEPNISLGRLIPLWASYLIRGIITFIILLLYLFYMFFKIKKDSKPTTQEEEKGE